MFYFLQDDPYSIIDTGKTRAAGGKRPWPLADLVELEY